MITTVILCCLLLILIGMALIFDRRSGMQNVPRGFDCESIFKGLTNISISIAIIFGVAILLTWLQIEISFWMLLVLPLLGERILLTALASIWGATAIWGIIVGRKNPYARKILFAAATSSAGLLIDWGLWYSMTSIMKNAFA